MRNRPLLLYLIGSAVFLSCSTPALKKDEVNQVAKPVERKTEKVILRDPPLVGSTQKGQRIYLGGFSGLRFLEREADGTMLFLTHTDRGPNAELVTEGDQELRPFLLPKFQPRIVVLAVSADRKNIQVRSQILLKKPNGEPLTGLPIKEGKGNEEAVDLAGKKLSIDPYGMDLESIEKGVDGSYWMSEEYAPSLAKFAPSGQMLEVLRPGHGLPILLEQRRVNRGFEGIALFKHKLFAVLQGPLDNPRSEGQKNSKKSKVARLLEIDLGNKSTVGQYAIYFDKPKLDRIGDLYAESSQSVLTILQDGNAGTKSKKEVVRLDLSKATNLQLLSDRIAGVGGSLELMKESQLSEAKIVPIAQQTLVDLNAQGVVEEKVEGISLTDDGWLVVVTDNDFGLDGAWDRTQGTVTFKNEPSALYFIPPTIWNGR